MKIILNITILFFSLAIYSQNFSGKIEYNTEIILKNDKVDIDSILSTKRTKKKTYLITDNFYKTSYIDKGEVKYSYSYDNISKRMYDNYADREYITYRDSRKSNYGNYSSEIFKDSTTTILDLDCFMVKHESEYGKSKSYYSDEIRVNYSSFEEHKVGNWYEKLKDLNGCLPLKTITEFEDYIQITEATKITEMELSESDFQIANNKIIVAFYTALDERVKLNKPSKSESKHYKQLINDGVKGLKLEKDYKIYVSFVLSKNGEIKYVKALKENKLGLDKIAENVIKNCELKFTPGKIDGRYVSSQAYFPVEFKK
ncbi:energy transducer TonB [Psychroflexus aestuariivivens]|uniref:energy transducer TonB n=1 Tax=Psychroflexus aestuariivivens TaxID=1795040 RepID=UPI000FDA1DD0|nr:energy transducer TonB [Psychroflexus aestuariivivens]